MKPLDSAIVTKADPKSRTASAYSRFAFALIAFTLAPLLLLGAFVIAVDPYYAFGSPSRAGFNAVRPLYEPHVLVAKPYQVLRLQPSAVALGSSRVEVGIDPRHGGWSSDSVFNFGLPSSTSYAVMLAFLHAQKLGKPLKQAVAGLDFFAFNINYSLSAELGEQRFVGGIGEFAAFLDETLSDRRKHMHEAAPEPEAAPAALPDTAPVRPPLPQPPVAAVTASWADDFNSEEFYLAVNQDVAAAVARKDFKSGRQHWELIGRAEHRQAAIPADWQEAEYLAVNQDVAIAVSERRFLNGYHHYLAVGLTEGRLGGFRPKGWSETRYLAVNPDVAAAVASGMFLSGYHHYAAAGRLEGRLGAFPVKDWNETEYLALNQDVAFEVARGLS